MISVLGLEADYKINLENMNILIKILGKEKCFDLLSK